MPPPPPIITGDAPERAQAALFASTPREVTLARSPIAGAAKEVDAADYIFISSRQLAHRRKAAARTSI